MEFDELQQIWDAQNNEPLYDIDELVLHNRIRSKKKQARHTINISEIILIIINLGAGSFILATNLFPRSGNIFMYLLAAWMFATSLYLCASRIRRIRGDRRFDRSIHGDLDYAISVVTYQVRLSQILRWNNLPMAALCLLGAGESRKLLLVVVVIGISFVLSYYVGNWEQRFYKARKRELEILRKKLETRS